MVKLNERLRFFHQKLSYALDQCVHMLIAGEWWKGSFDDWKKLR